MTDEEEKKVETGVTDATYASMLGEAIKSKDAEIESLKEQQAKRVKELTDMIVNGQEAEENAKQVEVVKSRKELYEEYQKLGTDTSNYDFWSKFIELRDATIRENGKDPCVTGNFGTGPNGAVQPAYGEPEAVEGAMDEIKELLEDCNGDKELFRVKFAQKFR